MPQIQYSWLWKLANVTQSPYSYIWSNDTGPELVNGPSRKSMYVTALYFTMTCMTSVSCTLANKWLAICNWPSLINMCIFAILFPTGGLRQCRSGDRQREGVHHLHDDHCRCCVQTRSVAASKFLKNKKPAKQSATL